MESNSTSIEIPDGTVINTNTIWDSNVYLWGYVYVDNAMLIIKPGVTVKICTGGFFGGIVVRNNGCIIANGTPGNEITFRPCAYIPYEGYEFAVGIDETASSLCEVSYCTIIDAEFGIVILNNRLENPIHDNSIRYCCHGIVQDGPMLTDVVNNEIFYTSYIGIDANLADINGVASNTAEILIGNNTVVGSYENGIVVRGVEDPNEAGEVTIANNLIAGSGQYAIYPVNGWMQLAMYCNGFYANNGNVFGSDEGGQMSGGTADPNSVVIEDFNSYGDTPALRDVWKDFWTQSEPKTAAEVSVEQTTVIDGNSMKYEYKNYYWPYYSEAEAEICDLPSGVGSDWTVGDINTLTLYFYGQLSNDTGEQMYVKLTDGDESDFNSVDNFDSYGGNEALKAVWKDYWSNGTSAEVFTEQTIVRSVQSMKYKYSNKTYSPYYSEAEADINDLPSGIGSDWTANGVTALVLWFYG
jgi:hypothetical protein